MTAANQLHEAYASGASEAEMWKLAGMAVGRIVMDSPAQRQASEAERAGIEDRCSPLLPRADRYVRSRGWA